MNLIHFFSREMIIENTEHKTLLPVQTQKQFLWFGNQMICIIIRCLLPLHYCYDTGPAKILEILWQLIRFGPHTLQWTEGREIY